VIHYLWKTVYNYSSLEVDDGDNNNNNVNNGNYDDSC